MGMEVKEERNDFYFSFGEKKTCSKFWFIYAHFLKIYMNPGWTNNQDGHTGMVSTMTEQSRSAVGTGKGSFLLISARLEAGGGGGRSCCLC